MPDSVLFGRFALLLDQRRLLENHVPISLGARAFDLLATLVQHRDRVVSKDELLTLVWRDAVVEENNLSVQISTLRKVLGADALQTVVGQGYRFTLAVSAAPAGSFEGDMVLGLPDKPSIAVLPFDCVGNGWTGMHLVDTMGDDLIDALSRLHSIFVISRHSVQSYRGRAVHPREVARELGVRYVLEGSVRRLAVEVRIAAALIDALTGQQIWSEGYAWGWGDGSAPQHAIVRAIVIAMVPHIEHSEIERARLLRPQSSSAYALAQRAWAQSREGLSRSNRGARDAAIALAREALAIDPRCSAALNAIVDTLSWHMYFDTAPPSALADALDATACALAIDSNDALAWRGRGWLMLVSGRLQEAVVDFRRSLELEPERRRHPGTAGHLRGRLRRPGGRRGPLHAGDSSEPARPGTFSPAGQPGVGAICRAGLRRRHPHRRAIAARGRFCGHAAVPGAVPGGRRAVGPCGCAIERAQDTGAGYGRRAAAGGVAGDRPRGLRARGGVPCGSGAADGSIQAEIPCSADT